MGYELQAIIARTDAFDRYRDASWYRYVVQLNQGFSMLPLHEPAWEASNLWDDALEHTIPIKSVEVYYGDRLAVLLRELSRGGTSVFLRADCAGGVCHKLGLAYRDEERVFDRSMWDTAWSKSAESQSSSGLGDLWKRLRGQNDEHEVRNQASMPTHTDQLLVMLGVVADGELDAWDELGLGRYRETAEWPGGPEHE
ncbi:MAG: hypothetical protein JJ916_09385 [Phycisphaerales bacterium]|nr:hypothetical protein [Phycisphaerales bacterium]